MPRTPVAAKDPASAEARPRRRVGFRKGADIDEELWPAETFGGVSDEQFWDDLASDKPLTTTARTAQQEAAPRNRLLDTGPDTDPQGTQVLATSQARADRDERPRADRSKADRAPGDRNTGEGRRGAGSGAYPGPRTAPDPAAERTAVQPAYAATQPAQGMPAQGTPAQGMPAAAPGEKGRRRRPSSAEDDPLTSSAFSLRPSGPVDGRSALRSRDVPRDQNGTTTAAVGRGRGPDGRTAPYPLSGSSYDDAASVTQMMSTPPYGENYGYGSPAAQPDQPRRQNGPRSHARPGGTGERPRPPRPAYPPGSYEGGGSQAQGGGARGGGHRAPYDPRDDYRRLTHRR